MGDRKGSRQTGYQPNFPAIEETEKIREIVDTTEADGQGWMEQTYETAETNETVCSG